MNKLLFWLFLASQGAKVIKIIELNGTSAIFFKFRKCALGSALRCTYIEHRSKKDKSI